MTSFLRLNGIAVPVALGGASLDPETIGKKRRSANGSGNASRRLRKGGWKFSSTLRTAAEALAFRELLAGEGHVLSFDNSNPYTSQGMAPVAFPAGWGYSALAKYGSRAALSDITGAAATWAFFASGAPWTVAWWRSSGTYHHYVQTSAGTKWIDGVLSPGGTMLGFNGVTSGVASFGSVPGAQDFFDDIVALPYVVPADWPAQIYGFGFAFGLLPQLTADGLFIEQNTRVTVLGPDAPSGRVVATATAKNFHDFAFELSEV